MSVPLNNTSTTTGGITMPNWYDQLSTGMANTANQLLGQATNLNANWYDQPLNAGNTAQQTGALTSALTPYDYQSGLNKAQGNLNNYQTTYDPNQTTSQFMDPYTNSAIKSVYDLSNQNLTENVLPAVNSTFTGAGQFGSSRDAEFNQRAIRDANQTATNTAGNMLNNQWNNAQTQQANWNNNNLTAANAQKDLTNSNQADYWNTVNNQYNLGAAQQATQQTALNNNYTDWQNSIATPTAQFGALAASLPQYSQMWTKTPTSSATTATPAKSLSGLGALGALTYGAGTAASSMGA